MCCFVPIGLKEVAWPERYLPEYQATKRAHQASNNPGRPRSSLPPGVANRAAMPNRPAMPNHAAMLNRAAMLQGGGVHPGGGANGGMHPGGGVYRGGHGGGPLPGRGGPANRGNPYGGGHSARGRSHSRTATRGSTRGNSGYRGGLRGPNDRGIPGSANPSRAGSRQPSIRGRNPTVDDGIDGRDPSRGRSTQVPRRAGSVSGRPPTRGGSTRVPRRAGSTRGEGHVNDGMAGRAPSQRPAPRAPAGRGPKRPPDANGINAIGEQINDMTYLNNR